MATPAWLGSPLKWMASLGTGVLTGLLIYAFSLIGITAGHADPALWGFVTIGVAKGVGWLVATYGPQPAAPVAMKRTRRPRTPKPPPPESNGPNLPADLTDTLK